MSRIINLGDAFVDHFPVFESDGYTKKSGETVFAVSVWVDSAVSAVSTTVTEIGTTGEYSVSFTPTSAGEWTVQVLIDYNDEIWDSGATVKQETIEIGMTAVDDDSNISFALWVEQDGNRLTDFTSMAAVVRSSDGTEVHDLGTDSADTGDGVFEFTTTSANVPAGVEYYLDVTATRGSLTWYNNVGFAKV